MLSLSVKPAPGAPPRQNALFLSEPAGTAPTAPLTMCLRHWPRNGTSVAVRSGGEFGAGGDSSCEETVRAGHDLVTEKTLLDRKSLHLSYFSPGSGGPGDACRPLSARGGIVISARACAGRTISGRTASDLMGGDYLERLLRGRRKRGRRWGRVHRNGLEDRNQWA